AIERVVELLSELRTLARIERQRLQGARRQVVRVHLDGRPPTSTALLSGQCVEECPQVLLCRGGVAQSVPHKAHRRRPAILSLPPLRPSSDQRRRPLLDHYLHRLDAIQHNGDLVAPHLDDDRAIILRLAPASGWCAALLACMQAQQPRPCLLYDVAPMPPVDL